MNKKTIEINKYVFKLESDVAYQIHDIEFNIRGRLLASLSEDEIKQGEIYQEELLSGKWNWLLFHSGFIRMPRHRINITLTDPVYDGSVRWRGGSLTSGIKVVCEHCHDPKCYFDCVEATKWATIKDAMSCKEKMEELEGNRNYNYACDAIESIVLAHAQAGVNVESPGYLEGLDTAMDAIGNNI